jgi:ribosomal protein S18 acetylase RimI-like enzyme
MTASRLGALEPRHRSRLAEILAATGVFNAEEVAVALGLFDETIPAPGAASSPSSYEFVGAFDADTLVAYACYGPTPATDGTFDLYWIAVHPATQAAGEGTRLLDEVERRLLRRAGRLLVVETSSRDAYEPTRRFYAARGYREAARITDFYAPADDRVIYAKRLAPNAMSATHPQPTDQRGVRHHE